MNCCLGGIMKRIALLAISLSLISSLALFGQGARIRVYGSLGYTLAPPSLKSLDYDTGIPWATDYHNATAGGRALLEYLNLSLAQLLWQRRIGIERRCGSRFPLGLDGRGGSPAAAFVYGQGLWARSGGFDFYQWGRVPFASTARRGNHSALMACESPLIHGPAFC